VRDTPGNASTSEPASGHDVVGESIRRRYASSPGLIDLAAPHKLINRLYGFGRQRVPLLNRLLARWAVRDRISYSPLPLFWRFYRPHATELPAGYEPATLTPQTGRSHPVPALQLRQLSPGAAGRGGRSAPQLKGKERERPLADVGGHAVTTASEQRSSRTPSEDPVRVPPIPASGRREELPGSDRQSEGTSVLSLTREPSLLPSSSLSTGQPVPGSPLQPDPLKLSGELRPGPELELAHRPVEPQVTSRDQDPGAEITAAPGSGSTILAATRIAPDTAPDRPLLLRGSTVASGLFRRATSWLKSYTAEGFPALHLLRQAPGIARTEPASPPALSRALLEGRISFPLFRYHTGSSPWDSAGARPFSALPSGPRTSSHVEIHRSVKAQEPQPAPGSPFKEPPQSDERSIRTASSVSSAVDADRSGEISAVGAAISQSFSTVSGVGQTWIGLSRIGSGKGSIPFPIFRYPAGSSPWGSPGPRPFLALRSALPTSSRVGIYRSASATEAQPRPGPQFPESLQSDKGTAKTVDPALREADADRSVTVKGITPSPLSGPEFGAVQTAPRTLSRMSSKEGRIPLPLLEHGAGSSAGGGLGAADFPPAPQVPAKISRRDILRSNYPESPEPPQGPSAGTDKVQNSVESSPGERPPGLPILRAQPQRQPGPSSQQEHDSGPRHPVPVEAPGANRPLALAGLVTRFVPTVHRSLNPARPGSQENSDRSIGRTAFSLGATIASSMLFPLTGPGITMSRAVSQRLGITTLGEGSTARPGRQRRAANAAAELAPAGRALDPIVNSPIQAMLPPMLSRTVYAREDGHGDEVRPPVAVHSEWSAAPRAPILSRFVEPLRNAGFASQDAGRVLTTAVESNQVPSDQPFPARLGATAVPYAEASRAQEGQPPVLHSTGLGSVTSIARSMLSFPFHRAAEVTALPWGKTGASALVENQSSIANRQSPIINRQSSIVNRQSSVFPASGVPVSLISLRAPEALGDPGEGPLRYSGPELPLASAVQRRAGNGGGDQGVHAESPGGPAGPGDLAQRAISLPGTEGSAEPQVTQPAPPAPPPAGVNIEELLDRVVRRLVREVAIERERRGFAPWL
jgi:hypothetical protein